jgi:hypothetical protein
MSLIEYKGKVYYYVANYDNTVYYLTDTPKDRITCTQSVYFLDPDIKCVGRDVEHSTEECKLIPMWKYNELLARVEELTRVLVPMWKYNELLARVEELTREFNKFRGIDRNEK